MKKIIVIACAVLAIALYGAQTGTSQEPAPAYITKAELGEDNLFKLACDWIRKAASNAGDHVYWCRQSETIDEIKENVGYSTFDLKTASIGKIRVKANFHKSLWQLEDIDIVEQ